jgi:hypothetical protein
MNPFNGIESGLSRIPETVPRGGLRIHSMELKESGNGRYRGVVRRLQNPFNGIESQHFVELPQPSGLGRNPFNGIERLRWARRIG